MILLCENCEHGYKANLQACPWCQTSDVLAHEIIAEDVSLDIECYKDYFLVKIKSISGIPELFPVWVSDFQIIDHIGVTLDRETLVRQLSRCRVFTFNGNAYDVPMLTLALAGATNEQLKAASDAIIQTGLRSWQFYKQWNLQEPSWLDHIDLIQIIPGGGSLKIIGGKMHSRKIQDLPIDPSASIGLFDRPLLREYCGNDCETTNDAVKLFKSQIALRCEMSEEYGIDMRSKSDPQMAEAVMKAMLPWKVEPPLIHPGTTFFYQPPPWMRFIHLPLLEFIARNPFTVNGNGSVDMTEELAKTQIRIGNSVYRMGIGGLHSSESQVVNKADATYSIQDVDVASYYPALIINTGIYPPQIGPIFQEIYRSKRDLRIEAKKAKDTKKANSLKTFLNGVFGKLLNLYSIFYHPSGGIQVTITGQLALLMLIELLEYSGISVISANTDGIMIRCRRDMEWLRDQIVAHWCTITGFETEAKDYVLIASRDVNSYIALPADGGKPKLKGEYAPAEPGASGWPNPTGQICVDAIVAYLRQGTPLIDTIRACQDVRQFLYLRQVRGGGEWLAGAPREKKPTQISMRARIEQLGWVMYGAAKEKRYVFPSTGEIASLGDAYASTFPPEDPVFLGRACRWYYSNQDAGHIRYVASGNQVAKAEGCKPLMELPDTLPTDIDYLWYEREARSMLVDMGVLQ